MNIKKVKPDRGLGRSVPPLFAHVEIYFLNNGCSSKDAATFFQYYEERDWKGIKGKPLRNWKTLVSDWIYQMKREAYLKQKALYEKHNLYPGKTD